MDERCILCDHPKVGHFGSGCHRTSFLRGSCDCDFVEPARLTLSATAEQNRERATWWAHRIDITDARMSHAPHGSLQWQRLERLRKVADAARHHHIEMASALPAKAADEHATREGDDLLDLICIESIVLQPPGTLDLMLRLFDRGPAEARDAVRIRLETEFDSLEPRHRRALMEDDAIRGALEHMGVMTSLRATASQSAPPVSPMDETPVSVAIAQVMDDTLLGSDLAHALAHELGRTIGDDAFALTERVGDRPSADDELLSRYRHMRSQLEAYWRHWAAAPSTAVQRELVTRHPDAFRRQMVLAIQILTPPEKARFTDRAELFGWVASGMLPLFVDDTPVPLEDIVEARYLALPDR
jgi:hypothetical protein